MGDNNDEYARTKDFDWRSHVSGMSMWEILHPVLPWLQPSEPHWKPTYVDEVAIGHHYLPRQPEDVSSIRGAKHLMTDGDSADGVYV